MYNLMYSLITDCASSDDIRIPNISVHFINAIAEEVDRRGWDDLVELTEADRAEVIKAVIERQNMKDNVPQ